MATTAFGVLWLIALALFAIEYFGWSGQPGDPLSALFLILLGLPWNRFLDGVSDQLRPLAAALAPGINLSILRFLCNRLGVR